MASSALYRPSRIARQWRRQAWGTGAGAPPLECDARTIFFLYFGQENRIFLATRSVLWPKICRKCDSGRGSAPDPAGGDHDVPPDPLVGCGADTSLHTPPHSAPRCSRLWRFDRRAPLTPNPGDATGVVRNFKFGL